MEDTSARAAKLQKQKRLSRIEGQVWDGGTDSRLYTILNVAGCMLRIDVTSDVRASRGEKKETIRWCPQRAGRVVQQDCNNCCRCCSQRRTSKERHQRMISRALHGETKVCTDTLLGRACNALYEWSSTQRELEFNMRYA